MYIGLLRLEDSQFSLSAWALPGCGTALKHRIPDTEKQEFLSTTIFSVVFQTNNEINMIFWGVLGQGRGNKAYQQNVTKDKNHPIFLTEDWPKHLRGHRPKHQKGQHY